MISIEVFTTSPDGSVTLRRSSPVLVWPTTSTEQLNNKTTIFSMNAQSRSGNLDAPMNANVMNPILSLKYPVRRQPFRNRAIKLDGLLQFGFVDVLVVGM